MLRVEVRAIGMASECAVRKVEESLPGCELIIPRDWPIEITTREATEEEYQEWLAEEELRRGK